MHILQARGGGATPRVSTIERFVRLLSEPAVELPLRRSSHVPSCLQSGLALTPRAP